MSKATSNGQKERRSDIKTESAKAAALPKADGALAFSLTAGAIGIGVALLDQAKAAATVNTAEVKFADLVAASEAVGEIATSVEFSTDGGNTPFAVQDVSAMIAAVEPGQPMPDPAGINLMTLLQKIEDFLQDMEASSTQGGQATTAPVLNSELASVQASDAEQYASLDTGTATDAISSGPAGGGAIPGGGHVVSPAGPTVTDPLDQFQDMVQHLDDLLGKGGPGGIPIVGPVVPGLLEPVDSVLGTVSDLVGGLLEGGEGSGVGGLVEGALDTVGDVVGGLTDAVDGLTDTLDEVVGGITSTVTGTLDGVGNVVDGALGAVTDLVENVLGGKDAGAGSDGGEAGNIVGRLTDSVGDVVDGLTGTIGGVLGSVTSVATGALDGVGSLLGGLFGGGASNPQDDILQSADDQIGNLQSLTPQADPISIAGLHDTLSSYGQEQPNIFEAAEGALQFSEGLINLITPTISFIGQPIAEGNEHHDFANSNGSLLHGLI